MGVAWFQMSVILSLRRLRQENIEFKANMGYTVSPHFKIMNKPGASGSYL
jgi:hypothetical protein